MTKALNMFGQRHGPFPRLYSELIEYETGDGLSYVWKRFIENADDQILEDLLASLKRGNRMRNILLVSVICYGHDGMTTPLGKSGKLKRTTRRFAYHAMVTIDMICFLGGLGACPKSPLRMTEYTHLIRAIQLGYQWLTPPAKARPNGPLNSDEVLFANAFVVAKGDGVTGVREPVVHAIATNYESLRPYFRAIYASGKGVDGINALLATMPEPALSEGAL
jgi:hypothetical protein